MHEIMEKQGKKRNIEINLKKEGENMIKEYIFDSDLFWGMYIMIING